jgi:hypothetical protein
MMTPGSANFSMIPGGAALALSPGGSGSVTVAMVPENGFSGTINLTCAVVPPTGAVDTPACSLPSSESISGTTFVNASVMIATTGTTVARNAPASRPRSNPSRRTGGAILACLGLLIGNLARRGRKSLQLLLLILLVALPLAACGGGGSSGGTTTTTGGTSAGNYVVTVTGTASGLTAVSTQIVVTVN